MRALARVAGFALAGALLAVGPLAAQDAPTEQLVTREALEARADSLQRMLEGSALTAARRGEISRSLQEIRTRLERGDFRSGDALRVQVVGDTSLSGSYRLDARQEIQLGNLAPVSLRGALFSEAAGVIEEHLRQYIRSPEVRVQPLIRVGVLGAVGAPGFYDLPPQQTIADALMAAGGLAPNAEVEKLKHGEEGERISADGTDPTSMPLAEFAARDGNRIFVPGSQQGSFLGTVAPIVGIATSIVVLFTRI